MDAVEQYTTWADHNNFEDRILVVPHPEFEVYSYEVSLNRPFMSKFSDHYEYKNKNEHRIKLYNALQKRPRAHRAWLFSSLLEADLLDDGINSMNYLPQDHTWYDHRVMKEEQYKRMETRLPMLPPHDELAEIELAAFSAGDSGKYQMEYNVQIGLDSWVTVISEAGFAEDTCFLSEKVFKPIAACQPFIIFGNRGSLENLRKLGYRTFEPLIDETYDQLPTWERLDAIIASLIQIKHMPDKLAWYRGFEEIVTHNYEVMRRNCEDKVPDSYVTILEYFRNSDVPKTDS
jgi:hypothetical protein